MATRFETSIDSDAIDIAQEKLKLADDVAIWPVWEDGERTYRVERKNSNRFYRLGAREYTFVSLLDGKTTVAVACGLAASRLGTQALSGDEAESIVVWMIGEGIATTDGSGIQGLVHGGNRNAEQPATSIWKRLNPFWMQLPLVKHPQRFESLLSALSWLLTPTCTLIGTALILIGFVAYLLNLGAVNEAAVELFTPSGWIYLLAVWVALKIVHELGHAIACFRQGGEIGESGIVMILFAPLAYVDVTSCWRMPRPAPRMLVSAAGMYVELVIASVAMLLWLYLDSPQAQFWLSNVIVTAGVSTILFNANPLMRFDGYYLLSDAIQIPNLYGEASQEVKRIAARVLIGEKLGECHYRGFRRAFLIVYGLAALAWRLLICFTLCVSASVMFSGAGIVLAVFGVVCWFGVPLKQWIVAGYERFQLSKRKFARSAGLSFAVGSFVLLLVAMPFPTSVAIPGTMQDPPEAIVRSLSEGFVTQIHVADGQRVVAGQPLVTLENRHLNTELTKLELSRAEFEIRRRIASDSHDASGEWIANQDLSAVERQISELKPKVDGLTVVAPHDGIVRKRGLASLAGQFVSEGDELIRVTGRGRPEVMAAVHQDVIRKARSSVGTAIEVRDARNRRVPAKLISVDPRASRELPDEALSTLNGGPLEVRQSDPEEGEEESFRLVEPHFVARAEFNAEVPETLRSGTRVRMHLGHRYESLWQRARVAMRRFWKSQWDLARS